MSYEHEKEPSRRGARTKGRARGNAGKDRGIEKERREGKSGTVAERKAAMKFMSDALYAVGYLKLLQLKYAAETHDSRLADDVLAVLREVAIDLRGMSELPVRRLDSLSKSRAAVSKRRAPRGLSARCKVLRPSFKEPA